MKCQYLGCENRAKSEGYCVQHYERYLRVKSSAQVANLPEISPQDYPAVYVLGAMEMPYVKIGRAKNVWRRSRDIQVGCPYEVVVFGARFSHPKFTQALEMEVQRTLVDLDCHHRGEWFDIAPDDALAVIGKCATIHGYKTMSEDEYADLRSCHKEIAAMTPMGEMNHFDLFMASVRKSRAALTITDV